MEKNYYLLGSSDNSKFIKLIRIVFGIMCIMVSIYWIYFTFNNTSLNLTLLVTILFLILFGIYQFWSGLGHATRFIEIGTKQINLKKNALLNAINIPSSVIERIELFPLNVIFYMNSGKRILLRFGTTYHETSKKIMDEIINFSERNHIPLEKIEEKF